MVGVSMFEGQGWVNQEIALWWCMEVWLLHEAAADNEAHTSRPPPPQLFAP